jgi:hypothetical protein
MWFEPDNLQRVSRLLAFKRHERPPVGYFDRFPREIIARIRAEECAPDSLWESVASRIPCFQQLLTISEPLAGAVGLAVCGVLIRGFIISDSSVASQSAPLTLLTSYATGPSIVRAATSPAHSSFFQFPAVDSSWPGGHVEAKAPSSVFQELRP